MVRSIFDQDPWRSLRTRLANGPNSELEDETYVFTTGANVGELALWTLQIRADYVRDLLEERDALAARVEELERELADLRGEALRLSYWGEDAMWP